MTITEEYNNLKDELKTIELSKNDTVAEKKADFLKHLIQTYNEEFEFRRRIVQNIIDQRYHSDIRSNRSISSAIKMLFDKKLVVYIDCDYHTVGWCDAYAKEFEDGEYGDRFLIVGLVHRPFIQKNLLEYKDVIRHCIECPDKLDKYTDLLVKWLSYSRRIFKEVVIDKYSVDIEDYNRSKKLKGLDNSHVGTLIIKRDDCVENPTTKFLFKERLYISESNEPPKDRLFKFDDEVIWETSNEDEALKRMNDVYNQALENHRIYVNNLHCKWELSEGFCDVLNFDNKYNTWRTYIRIYLHKEQLDWKNCLHNFKIVNKDDIIDTLLQSSSKNVKIDVICKYDYQILSDKKSKVFTITTNIDKDRIDYLKKCKDFDKYKELDYMIYRNFDFKRKFNKEFESWKDSISQGSF